MVDVVKEGPVLIAEPPVELANQEIVPVDAVALRFTVPAPHLEAGVVLVIDGTAFTVIKPVFVSTSLPAELVAVKVTLYTPGVLYVTEGFVAVDVLGVPPVNVQLYDVGPLVLVLVNAIVSPAQIVVLLAVKSATGTKTVTMTVTSIVFSQPLALVTTTW